MPTARDLAETDDPLAEQALAVLQQLGPELDAERWALVRSDPVGQRPTVTVVVDGEAVTAVASWRLLAVSKTGRTLYVDDLVTDAAVRSGGHGALLLGHLRDRAAELGASELALDSGVHRHAAHRFYLRERMDITDHHFTQGV